MEEENKTGKLEGFHPKYLTDEQIEEIRELLQNEVAISNFDGILLKIKGYLLENDTYNERMDNIYSLFGDLKKLTKDEELLSNAFFAPGAMYLPFICLGLMVELEIYDEESIKVETRNTIANALAKNKPFKNEA